MTTDIISVGDTKIEVDLSGARKVDSFRVGDNVKLLKKQYGESYKVYPGVIVGFEAFKTRPTIVLCYLDSDFSSTNIKFEYLHKDSEDVEIAPMLTEELALDKADIMSKIDTDIQKKQIELDELKSRKNYFVTNFSRHFGDLKDA